MMERECSMKKYLRVYKIFFQNAVSRESQYRLNAWLNTLFNVVWLGVMYLMMSVLFEHTTEINGWTKNAAMLLMLGWTIADEIQIIFFNNITNIPNTVVEGNLDMYVTKPINTLFAICTKNIALHISFRLITDLFVFIAFIFHHNIPLSLINILLGIFLLFCGTIITASFTLILNTFSFWFERIDNINDAWFTILNIGSYPTSILPKTLRVLFFTIIPIAFVAYLPVGVFTGQIEKIWTLYGFGFTICITSVAILFWNFALKKYSSASS